MGAFLLLNFRLWDCRGDCLQRSHTSRAAMSPGRKPYRKFQWALRDKDTLPEQMTALITIRNHVDARQVT